MQHIYSSVLLAYSYKSASKKRFSLDWEYKESFISLLLQWFAQKIMSTIIEALCQFILIGHHWSLFTQTFTQTKKNSPNFWKIFVLWLIFIVNILCWRFSRRENSNFYGPSNTDLLMLLSTSAVVKTQLFLIIKNNLSHTWFSS